MSNQLATRNDIYNLRLEKSTADVIVASLDPKRVSLYVSKEVLAPEIYPLIERLYIDVGYKAEAEDKRALCIIFSEDLLTDFRGFTLEEVRLTLRRGARGFYGEFMGINTRTLYAWLGKYRAEKIAAEKMYKAAIPLPQEPEDKRTPYERRKGLYDKLVEYVIENNRLPFTWAWVDVLEYMIEAKVLPDAAENWKSFLPQAEAILKEDKLRLKESRREVQILDLESDYRNGKRSLEADAKTLYVKDFIRRTYVRE